MDSLPPGAIVNLGPFQLDRPIGRGGMAQVWRATHDATGTPVAIKVVGGEATRQHRWLARFRNEIRAVAGLRHPGIVHVHDFGEISREGEGASLGLLRAGSPYLVMELVEGGSLKRQLGQMDWPMLRSTLLRLLDALAHAHAHGLIHRDITPGNVLGDGGSIKLADFGLSHQVEASVRHKAEMGVSGTPAFMAPEQWEGRWRDYGPWTDLYGLGCLTWAMVAGRPPFRAPGDLAGLRDLHLWEKLPPLRSRTPLPAGFEDWLGILLSKDPAQRFRRAADAASGLLALPELLDEDVWAETTLKIAPIYPEVGASGDLSAESASVTHTDLDAEASPDDTRWAVVLPEPEAFPMPRVDSLEPAWQGARPAPMPSSWRSAADDLPVRFLPGAGLRLYGFRSIPVVGRDGERTALWDALRLVRSKREPRAVLLSGSAGCGKSRLARWLCERAHEVGAATVLKVTHAAIEGPNHGLSPAVRRFLDLDGLDRDAAFSRIREVLRREGVNDPYEWSALTEFVKPRQAERTTQALAVYFGDPGERFAVVTRFLARISRERPVVIWFDDVHWGAEGLRFIEHLLTVAEDLPVMVVATVRDDVLASRPFENELLRGVTTRLSARTLQLGPLPRADWRRLVQQIIQLEEDLAAQVEERTAGNPLFAVQLVADWVQRGALEPGPSGFRLVGGLGAALPDNLHQVWQERMARIFAGLPASDRLAVQMAAVLGQEFDGHEWADVCTRAGVAPSAALLERLQGERLLTPDEHGGVVAWRFAHGMLRETVELTAEESGGLKHLHLLCAHMLAERGDAVSAERIGRHLLAAEEYGAALEPLLDGATLRRENGEFRNAELLLTEREEALRELDVPDGDPRWVEGWVLLASLEVERHRLDRAGALAERACRVAGTEGHLRLEGWANQVLGRVSCLRGQLDVAVAQIAVAAERAHAVEDEELVAACLAGRGMTSLMQDKLDEAARCCRDARRVYAETGQWLGAASMSLQLSTITLRAGRISESGRHVADALSGFESVGALNSIALCITQRAAIERAGADLGAAEMSLREAYSIYDRLGTDGFLVPLIQLAVVLLELENYAEARELLNSALEGLERVGGWASLGALHILALPTLAVDGDWEEFDRLVNEADLLITNSGLVHDDVPLMARRAGDIARRAGETDRAARAYHLALSQWYAMGELRQVAVTRASLHGMLNEAMR
ncbi:MAG: protein kinase [Deltaproteobacteria bacterium]|nr:protein kinase [Deltaproteobacteria bacterium]